MAASITFIGLLTKIISKLLENPTVVDGSLSGICIKTKTLTTLTTKEFLTHSRKANHSNFPKESWRQKALKSSWMILLRLIIRKSCHLKRYTRKILMSKGRKELKGKTVSSGLPQKVKWNSKRVNELIWGTSIINKHLKERLFIESVKEKKQDITKRVDWMT